MAASQAVVVACWRLCGAFTVNPALPVRSAPDRVLWPEWATSNTHSGPASLTDRQGVTEHACFDHLGQGEWLVQYGTSAAWKG